MVGNPPAVKLCAMCSVVGLFRESVSSTDGEQSNDRVLTD
jgi:hypothetical protein